MSSEKTSDLFRTDTNIVASINLEKKTVDMISIPRDSYVLSPIEAEARTNSQHRLWLSFGGGR